MPATSRLVAASVTAIALLAGGCASTSESRPGAASAQHTAARAGGAAAPTASPTATEPAPSTPDPAPATFLACAVFDAHTGQRLAWNDLVARCASAGVVIIGEEHDLTPAQMMAADLFAAIVEKRPDAALSLEFFERDEQIHLDDYIAGITNEEQFRAATGRREGNYPDGHRAMIETARARHVPVIASNAPRRYVRIARTDGYDALARLTDPQRQTFVVPRRMPAGAYHDDFIAMMSAMGAHGGDQAGPQPSEEQRRSAAEAMFRSQSLWDSTMADAIGNALKDRRRPVVHVVGRFHVDNNGGTLQMLRTLRPSVRVVTLSCQRGMHATLQDDDKNRADIVVYTDEVEAEPAPEGDASPAGN